MISSKTRFRAFRDVGDTFFYMGINMTVNQIKFRKMYADYVDGKGELHSWMFHIRELKGLVENNTESDF